MSGVNKVIILGRLGADPELRSTQGGTQVCTLNVATSESWTKDGKKEERTEWHRVVLWGKQAELAERYLKKGRQVYLEGRLQTRSWDDAQGQKRYTTEIVGNVMQFVDGGSRDATHDRPPMDDGYGAPSQQMGQNSFSSAGSDNSGSSFGSSDFNAGIDIPF